MQFKPLHSLVTMMALCLIALTSVGAHAQDALQFLDANGSNTVTISYNFQGGSHTEDVYAGAYNVSVNGGPRVQGFCTDVSDDIYGGETWKANQTTTSASNGLASTWYGNNGQISKIDVGAIDYVVQQGDDFTDANQRTDAQLAIWDLTLGSQVQYNSSTGQYRWGTSFSAVADNASVYDPANQTALAFIYNLEQAGLAKNGASSGSVFEKVIDGSQPSGFGRPQDFAFSSMQAQPFVTPEVSSVGAWAGVFAISSLALLRRRRRA